MMPVFFKNWKSNFFIGFGGKEDYGLGLVNLHIMNWEKKMSPTVTFMQIYLNDWFWSGNNMGMVGYGHRGRVAGWALPGVGSGWSKLFPKLCFLISTRERHGVGGNYWEGLKKTKKIFLGKLFFFRFFCPVTEKKFFCSWIQFWIQLEKLNMIGYFLLKNKYRNMFKSSKKVFANLCVIIYDFNFGGF
jgi:hypothetical protein